MDNVRDFPEELFRRMQQYCRNVPSPVETQDFVDRIIHLLFPLRGYRGVKVPYLRYEWERVRCLFIDLLTALDPMLGEHPEELSQQFFESIPAIHEQLLEEACFFVACDPAANCPEEVMLCYPGFYAIAVYRIAHELYRLNIPILPRAVSEYAHNKTGIDIHPGATIGRFFYIDHGTGTVIGETTHIGDNVKIYQGVTLGAMYVEKKLQNTKRHPTIENDAIVYAGSTILGGDTVIGHHSIVGGNVWLTESVAPYSLIHHKAEVVIREQKNRK